MKTAVDLQTELRARGYDGLTVSDGGRFQHYDRTCMARYAGVLVSLGFIPQNGTQFNDLFVKTLADTTVRKLRDAGVFPVRLTSVERAKYECSMIPEDIPGWGPTQHLRIKRLDNKDGIAWDVLQHLKNEVAGENAIAIEVFPQKRRMIYEANVRHLWIVPPQVTMPDLSGDK